MSFSDGTLGGSDTSATGSSGTFGSFKSFSSGPNLDTSEGLLALAQQQGGALGEVANELVHPTAGILSTIGNGFKNSFKGFVDIISAPSQIVAGVLSSKYTISEALKNNISPSDVIWGEKDGDATTMQKIGSFLVRTATDILLDPLTYVTFGAGQGIAGLRSTTKITLEEGAAKMVGKETLEQAALSKSGQDVFKYLKNVEMQQNGLSKALQIKSGGEVFDLAGKELESLLRETIDAPLNMDFAKKAMSNLLEKHPALTETLLDKGGIKFFGQTMMSGQRIGAAIKMVPGMTALDHITEPARRSIQALFDPSLVKTDAGYVRVPQEALDIIQAGEDLRRSRNMGKGMELSDIVRANKLSVEEAKLVTAAIEAKKLPADPRLANAVKQFLGFTEEEFNFLAESGIPISMRDGHVPHILVKNENIKVGDIPLSRATKTSTMSTKTGASFERKAGETIAEAKENGFIFDENIVTAHYARTVDNTNAGVAKQVLGSLGEQMGQVKSLAPEGWIPVSLDGVNEGGKKLLQLFGDNGEQIVFHPAVAKKVEQFVKSAISDDATSDLLKAFDGIQNLWKAGVTSVFPAFHGRNAISNVFLNMMDLGVHVLDPKKHLFSGQLIATDRKVNKLTREAMKLNGTKAQEELNDILSKEMFQDATGHSWSFGEIRQVMKDKNIAFNKGLNGALDTTQPDKLADDFFKEGTKVDKAKRLAKKSIPISQDFFLFEGGREVGRAIEEQARILNFVANLKNTGDVTLAAQRTKQFLFDYSNLTSFERNFLKRVMPFYTFTRKNLELQAKTLASTPGRVSAEISIINNIGEALSGGELTDEEKAVLPEWIKSGIGILKNKKGSTIEMLGSLGSPIEQPFAAFQPNALLGSVSPLLRVPMEQMSGYSFFQGKALSEVTNAAAFKRAPKAIQDFIGFTEVKGHKSDGSAFTWYVALRPERMNIVNNLPLAGRVLSSVKQMEAQDVSTQMKTMQQLVGLRPYSFDLEQEAAKREAESKRLLESLLTKAGVTAQYKRTFIPKEKLSD